MKAFGVVLAVVLSLGTMVLFFTLLRDCRQGKNVIDAYYRAVQGGADVTEPVGGREAGALTALLRSGRSLSVANFESQQGTSCFFTTLVSEQGKTEVRFVLGDDEQRVTAASAHRNCDCPLDSDLPCHLVD